MDEVKSARWDGLLRWLRPVVGFLCVLIGATLVTRPFQSLAVLIILVASGMIVAGLSELANRSDLPNSTSEALVGIGWILLGLVVLLLPGLTFQTLAILVGIALIGRGVVRVFSTFHEGTDYRTAALLLGVASLILGIVSLSWPDITLLVVAVVFGVQMLLFGIAQLIGIFRDPGAEANMLPSGASGRFGRYMRTIGAALALLVSLVLAAISIFLHRGAPIVDAFYAAPAQVPGEPGVLLRTEPMSRAIPAGARAWRILYTTTRADGAPALASGLVVVATDLPPGPRPVIAWAHGTTGVDQSCAPSLLEDPFTAGAMPALDQVIAEGWVLVATDYIGLGTEAPHAYLVGQQAGRAVLDAVRAARQLPQLDLADQTVVWGHSQGGGAALWTGMLAPTYAPDVGVVGVAALAPASQLPDLVGNIDVVPGGPIFGSYVIQGFSDTYPDVRFNDYIRPTARVLVREMASRCLAEPEVFSSILVMLVIDKSILSTDPMSGALGQRLQENVPSGPIPAPLLIGQGLDDGLVLPVAQDAYVQARCAAGGQVDYRTYDGLGHVDIVGPESLLIPDLLTWTQERFDGKPVASTCEPH